MTGNGKSKKGIKIRLVIGTKIRRHLDVTKIVFETIMNTLNKNKIKLNTDIPNLL